MVTLELILAFPVSTKVATTRVATTRVATTRVAAVLNPVEVADKLVSRSRAMVLKLDSHFYAVIILQPPMPTRPTFRKCAVRFVSVEGLSDRNKHEKRPLDNCNHSIYPHY